VRQKFGDFRAINTMNTDKWAFIALRPHTVFWLLSYGKPDFVPRWVPKTFQIMACVVLALVIADTVYRLARKSITGVFIPDFAYWN
jgi:hypothetical protein